MLYKNQEGVWKSDSHFLFPRHAKVEGIGIDRSQGSVEDPLTYMTVSEEVC